MWRASIVVALGCVACSKREDPPARKQPTLAEREAAYEAEVREQERLEAPDPDEPGLPVALENPPVLSDLQTATLAIHVLDRDLLCVPMYIQHGLLLSHKPPGEATYWYIASSSSGPTFLTLSGPNMGTIDAAGKEGEHSAAACGRSLELVANEPGVYVWKTDSSSYEKSTTYKLSQTVRWYTDAARCKADLAKRKAKKSFRC